MKKYPAQARAQLEAGLLYFFQKNRWVLAKSKEFTILNPKSVIFVRPGGDPQEGVFEWMVGVARTIRYRVTLHALKNKVDYDNMRDAVGGLTQNVVGSTSTGKFHSLAKAK